MNKLFRVKAYVAIEIRANDEAKAREAVDWALRGTDLWSALVSGEVKHVVLDDDVEELPDLPAGESPRPVLGRDEDG